MEKSQKEQILQELYSLKDYILLVAKKCEEDLKGNIDNAIEEFKIDKVEACETIEAMAGLLLFPFMKIVVEISEKNNIAAAKLFSSCINTISQLIFEQSKGFKEEYRKIVLEKIYSKHNEKNNGNVLN